MPRPLPVTVTTILMCITNFVGFFLVNNWSNPHARSVFVIYSIFIVIGWIVLYFFWKGRNWARWLVLATSVLCLWNLWSLRKLGLSHGRVSIFNNHVRVAMVIAEAIIAIYLLYYLNTASARKWFTQPRQ
jgi:hypothetical protein